MVPEFDSDFNELLESLLPCDSSDNEIYRDGSDEKNKDSQDLNSVFVMPLKPRIFKSDIRRSYSNMLANVVNSGDFPLLYGMFDSFVTPDFRQITIKHCSGRKTVMERQGLSSVSTLWYAIMKMEPDAVVSLQDTLIHIVSNTTSCKIVTKFKFSATRLYKEQHEMTNEPEFPDVEAPPDNMCHAVGTKRKEIDCVLSKVDTINMITQSIEGMKLSLPLLSTPEPYCLQGHFIIITDENKFIKSIEMETFECPC